MSGFRLLPQNRGLRIRPYMRFLKEILFCILLFLFLLPIGYYAYTIQDKLRIVDRQSIYILVGMLSSSLLLSWYLQGFLFERTVLFASWDRIVRFARFLYEHNYVYEKKGQTQGRRKIKFPRIYVKQKKYNLEVAFELAGSKFQEKFKKIGGDLETTFAMDFMETEDDERFKTYRLAYSSLLNRLKGGAMKYVQGKGVELMKNFYWDFTSDPHMLIVGGTGGGKTVLLRFLILCLSKIGVVDICDPKRADFVTMADLKAFEGRIAYDVIEIILSCENALKVMEERFEYMRSEQKRLGHTDLKSFYEYGLEPYFWVCDELNAFKSMLTYKQVEEFNKTLGQIVLLGRQAGVNVILAMQKPSREDLGSKLQANINFRVAVGRLDDMGYELAFEEPNRNKDFKFMKYVGGMRVYGRGYAAVKGEVAREFYSPLLTKGFSFYNEFTKIERREHKHLLKEELVSDEKMPSKDLSGPGIEDDSEMRLYDLSDITELIGKSVSQIYTLLKKIQDGGFKTFVLQDNKFKLTEDDVMLLEELFEQKEDSGKTWDSFLKDYFSEE
nr:FtsK/SpoIIIE domain-containing protein [Streptococcus sp. S784/96/1]